MRYQKKSPDLIDALQYTGDNVAEILIFISNAESHSTHARILVVHKSDGSVMLHPGDYICRKVTTDTYNRSYACPGHVWESLMEPERVSA